MTENTEHYLTAEGAARLRAELDELKGPRRQELSKRLRLAIQQGDLSENADYTQTKEDQAFLEGRILELEILLQNARIIEEGNSSDGAVDIGSWVTIREAGKGEERYQVVGAKEASPREGRISYESPIGVALMGHRSGETVTAKTPGGEIVFEIVGVE